MFTVIVPVYNEEEIIRKNTIKLVEYLESLKRPYEIIILSNGSTDSTDSIGSELELECPSKVRFFSIPHRGVGRAFKKAVKEAKGDTLISIDADLTTDLKFIERALGLSPEYDIVIGSKKVGKQERSLFRVFISGCFILLVRLFLGMDYTDYSIGSKAYKKSVIEKWAENIDFGSAYVIELVFYAKKNGFKIKEIPVYCDDRRKSRFNLGHEVLYRFKNLLGLWVFSKILGSIP